MFQSRRMASFWPQNIICHQTAFFICRPAVITYLHTILFFMVAFGDKGEPKIKPTLRGNSLLPVNPLKST